MSPYLGAFACVLAGNLVLIGICVLIRHEIDAIRWRRLVEIAGSEEAALLVVEQARMQRELDDALLRKSFSKAFPRRATVTRLVPRIVNRGREVKFPPDGDAA